MKQQMDTSIDCPEATNYPWMPVRYLAPRPALPSADELGNGLAVASVAFGVAGLTGAVLGLLVTPMLFAVGILGGVAVVLGLAAAKKATRGEARGGQLARLGVAFGVAGIVLGVWLAVFAVV